MTTQKMGNPAVVGLAGFGLTTLLLQFHNIGLIGIGPVLAMAVIFGGLAQFIAGFQEHKVGNNFGYSAFVAYGSFWISLGIIWLLNSFGIYSSNGIEVGIFLIVWTVYTFIMMFAAFRIHTAMATTFILLFAGFILLDLGHFFSPLWNVVAGYELMLCAFSALYMMAAILYKDLAGRDILPMGKPWLV